MSDEEQIRLLTEIRDSLRAQFEFEREVVSKRSRSTITILLVFFITLIVGLFVVTKMAKNDAIQLMHERQKVINPETSEPNA